MGGCLTAIALASVGIEAQVYERTPGDLPSQGAGLVIQPDMAKFLHRFAVCDVRDVAVRSAGRQYVDRSGAVIGGNDAPQLFSAWDVLHRALKRKVLAGAGSYHSGQAVQSVEAVDDSGGGGVVVTLTGGERVRAQLLIGADG
jgi:2-polyprenyl-6-methoxyphenol hydroxylase-like FAD-dependent oxidoreductase